MLFQPGWLANGRAVQQGETLEVPDGNITTVGTKRLRCAEPISKGLVKHMTLDFAPSTMSFKVVASQRESTRYYCLSDTHRYTRVSTRISCLFDLKKKGPQVTNLANHTAVPAQNHSGEVLHPHKKNTKCVRRTWEAERFKHTHNH